jgi:hypothetical protein
MSCDLGSLGYLYQLTGDMGKSRTHLVEALRLTAPRFELKGFSTTALEHAGRLATLEADRRSGVERQKTLERAVRLYAGAQMIRESIGDLPVDFAVQERVSALQKATGKAAFEEVWKEGLAMSYDQVMAYALDYLENARGERGAVNLCERR